MDLPDEMCNTSKTHSEPGSEDVQARIAETLARLGACVRSVGQYGGSHPLIAEMAATAHLSLAELLVMQPTVVVAVAESYFAVESFPVHHETGCLAELAKLLRDRQVGEIRFTSGVTVEEIVGFAEMVSLSPEDLLLRGGTEQELARRKVTQISVRHGGLPKESRQGQDPAEIYEEALLLVEEAMRAVESGLRIPIPEIRGVVADSLQSLIQDDSTLLALAGIRSYDRYLAEHSVNVCIFSMVLGRDLGLDPSSTLELGISSMLHDVGKVFVPDDIVKKPGRLSEEEWLHMRQHPADGARALAGLPELPALAATIALEHHARGDGSGYPSLPVHQQPHLLSRLVAIVDSYDALTTQRPYRERWTPDQAISWMLYEGARMYDPQLMARFASRARLYPVGSLVRLKCGDYAVVVGGSPDHPRRPNLRVVTGAHADRNPPAIMELVTNTDPGLEIDSLAQPVEVLLPYSDRLIAA